MISQPFFIMCVGLPATGKSYFISTVLLPYLIEKGVYAESLSTDDLVNFCATGTKQTYTETFKDVISESQAIVNTRLSLGSYVGLNIILDQTNLTRKSRSLKMSLLRDNHRYNKIAICFDEDTAIIQNRLEIRSQTGKDISEAVLLDMKNRYESPSFNEGFDEIFTSPQHFIDSYLDKEVTNDTAA